MTVAIVGAGNLGTFLGVHLARAGHDVFFCARRPPGELRVEGFAPVTLPYWLQDPPPTDVTLLTVKAQASAAAARHWLPALTGGTRPTAVIQNGIHHAERIAPFPAVPVLAYVYVEAHDGWHRPFMVPREAFTVPAGDETIAGLFESAGLSVRREADFATAAWRKMLHNCVSNPLTALAGRGLEILREPGWRPLAERVLAEGLAIAQADGARLDAADAAGVLETLLGYPAGTRTSMLQDRERGRALELDALTGTLVKLGRCYSLPTVANEEILSKLSATD